MAQKPMKLRCTITLENDRTFTVNSKMFDGTPFRLVVSEYDIQLNQEFLPSRRTVNGWLYVQHEAEQYERAYITLPKPTINHGHNIVVNKYDLMPRYGVTIDDFKAKDVEAKKMEMDMPPVNPPAGPNTGVSQKTKPAVSEVVEAQEEVEMIVDTKEEDFIDRFFDDLDELDVDSDPDV